MFLLKKGLIGAVKIGAVVCLFLIVAFAIGFYVLPVFASAEEADVWTADVEGNYKNDFSESFFYYVWELRKSGKKLYGENVGEKFISIISDLIKKEKPFKWAHEAIGLWKEKDDMDYL